jgi:hypothetical protein
MPLDRFALLSFEQALELLIELPFVFLLRFEGLAKRLVAPGRLAANLGHGFAQILGRLLGLGRLVRKYEFRTGVDLERSPAARASHAQD